MTDKALPWMLGGVLGLVGLLAVGLLAQGPALVEAQAVELFRGQQQVEAEQLAAQMSQRLEAVARRLELPVVQEMALPHAAFRQELERGLARLSHPSDPEHGVTLFVHDDQGQVLAVAPNAQGTHGQKFLAHEHVPRPSPDRRRVGTCELCATKMGEVSVTRRLGPSRFLAANVDAAELARESFRRALEGRSGYAALLGDGGESLYMTGEGDSADAGDVVTATAEVEGTGWTVRVTAPRAAIAPEVDEAVRHLLIAAGTILFTVIGGLIGLLLWGRARQREHMRRAQALAHQDKLATLGTLSASVAHEVRNAIAVAKANLDFAAHGAVGQVREDVDEAAAAVARLAALADDLSNYAGKAQKDTERIDLAEVVDEARRIVDPKLKHRAVVAVDIEARAPVYAIRSELVQVVVNLLLNAAEACGGGRGCRIDVRVFAAQGRVGIVVDDNGPGFSDEARDRLFDPFFSTKGASDDGGTGIGLWLCAQILDQHGGEIRAEDRPKGGARFTVELPIAADEPRVLQAS